MLALGMTFLLVAPPARLQPSRAAADEACPWAARPAVLTQCLLRGFGAAGCGAVLGGRFLAIRDTLGHLPAWLPSVQQPFSPLARAAEETGSKLLSNTAVMGTNGKPN